MAQFANEGSPNGPQRDARTLLVNDAKGKEYFCTTNGCNARMHTYALETPNARFSSYKRADHVSISCFKGEVQYDTFQYVENLFVRDDFFANLTRDPGTNQFGNVDRTGQGNQVQQILNGSQGPINTLRMAYAMCCNVGIGGQYNGIPINDMLACRDNFDQKRNGFNGGYILEGSFYKYDSDEHFIDFNYPQYGALDDNVHVKLIFKDKSSVYNFYSRHIKNRDHTDMIIVGGIWEPCPDEGYIAQCEIRSVGRQFYFPE